MTGLDLLDRILGLVIVTLLTLVLRTLNRLRIDVGVAAEKATHFVTLEALEARLFETRVYIADLTAKAMDRVDSRWEKLEERLRRIEQQR